MSDHDMPDRCWCSRSSWDGHTHPGDSLPLAMSRPLLDVGQWRGLSTVAVLAFVVALAGLVAHAGVPMSEAVAQHKSMRDLHGDRDPGGSDLIAHPATGEIVRVHRRAFKAVDVTRLNAWEVTTVEPGINEHRPRGDTPSLVHWHEHGWYTVLSTWQDEHGNCIASCGEQLEPVL